MAWSLPHSWRRSGSRSTRRTLLRWWRSASTRSASAGIRRVAAPSLRPKQASWSCRPQRARSSRRCSHCTAVPSASAALRTL